MKKREMCAHFNPIKKIPFLEKDPKAADGLKRNIPVFKRLDGGAVAGLRVDALAEIEDALE